MLDYRPIPFGSVPHRLAVDRGRVLLSTHLDRTGETVRHELALRGDEGVILELTA